ncbi:Karyopherin transporter [Binucleata daphniae]
MEEEDLTQNFDIEKFTNIVSFAFDPSKPGYAQSQRQLIKFKESPNAWTHINTILTQTNDQNAHFIALQILEQAIKTRWNTFLPEQKLSLRNFIVQQILMKAKEHSTILEKFNIILVELLKRDWPRNWSTFIPDIVAASQNNGPEVCANSLFILRRLNEEIFIFSELTTVRREMLIRQMKAENIHIFNLINCVLEWSKTSAVDEKLMNAVFYALESFSPWLPLSFFCESNIIENVLFFVNSKYSLSVIKCINNIVRKRNKEITETENLKYFTETEDPRMLEFFEDKLVHMHKEIINFLNMYFAKFKNNEKGRKYKLHDVYNTMDRNEKDFLCSTSILLCSFYDNLTFLESKDSESLKKGLRYLIKISKVEDDKIFKNSLEFYKRFASEMYMKNDQSEIYKSVPYKIDAEVSLRIRKEANVSDETIKSTDDVIKTNKDAYFYEEFLKSLIDLIIKKMPRPEEVFITENEYGEIVKEKMAESDQILFYKNVKETFYYLACIKKNYTLKLILNTIGNLFNNANWSYEKMNKVCWAAGCVAGAFDESEESNFFVSMLKEMLTLCEMKYTKADKAVIASNIMFVIGQYDRFLAANTKFLKTVVKKLFEFMAETHEGIKDMAFDTFLKLTIKCGKLYPTQMENNENYILHIIKEIKTETHGLEYYQKRILYESVCNILQHVSEKQCAVFLNFFVSCFSCNFEIIDLNDTEMQHNDLSVICNSLRSYSILFDKLPIAINQNLNYLQSVFVLFDKCTNIKNKNSSLIRIEIIKLLIVVTKQGKKVNLEFLLSSMFDKILSDYKNNTDSVYLRLANEIINNIDFENKMQRDTLVLNLLEQSQNKVNENDERTREYFLLILSLLNNSFDTTFSILLSNQQFLDNLYQNVLNGLILEKEINETCLDILKLIICKCFEKNIYMFYQKYILITIENVLGILFDRDLTFTLEKQCVLFCSIMKIVSNPNMIRLNAQTDNCTFVSNYISELIVSNFTNVTQESLNVFIIGLFELNQDSDIFKDHVCDFRVKIYEFYSNEDVEEEMKLQEMRKNEIIKNKKI